MTTNPQSAKSRLFALYLGQKVFSHPDYSNRMAGRLLDDPIVELTISILYGNYIKKGWLQLRAIADLTDEEWITAIKLWEPNVSGRSLMDLETYKDDLFSLWSNIDHKPAIIK